jgi:hypothetical protein
MSPRVFTVSVLLWVLLAGSVAAQWPTHPDPTISRTADGSPDFEAPVPRTPEGKPDLSGVWLNEWFYGGRVRQPPVSPEGEPPAATFANLGANFPEGLPFQPWAKALMEARKEQNSKDNPDAHCLPMGLMQFHEHPQPRRMVQTPSVLLILYEGNSGVRQILTDGRPLPDNDPQPWWYGYSVGRWEGDTLVVETTGLRDGGWLDIWGSPLTDAAKITERFRRLNYGTMKIDVTIDDPKAYTRPFSVRVNQRIMPEGELIEFICNENNKAPQLMVGKGSRH